MNRSIFFIAVLLAAAFGAAASASPMPESQVSSPVEESVGPARASMDAQNASWEERRAERRAAREKILTRLRESSSQEKASVREELSKERNENSRSNRFSPENKKSPRNTDREAQQRREDRWMVNPDREMPMPPAPEYGDPNF